MKKKLVFMMAMIPALVMMCIAGGTAGSGVERYQQVLDIYKDGLSGNMAVLESDDFNYSAWQNCITVETDPLSAIGYALMDLDGDGSDELVIADNTEEGLLEGIVFDVWAVREGTPVLLLRGWERNRLYLTKEEGEDGYGFYQEGSSGAFNSVFTQGRFPDGEAVVRHILEYNMEAAALWQLDGVAVDEAEAEKTIIQWRQPIVRPELSPMAGLLP